MTQRDRVLAASRRFNGVAQTDFLLPDVCDGGPPITRLAARLHELDAEGFAFECLGRRQGCKIYRLCDEPESPVRSLVSSPGGGQHKTQDVSLQGPVSAEADAAQEQLFQPPSEPHWRAA